MNITTPQIDTDSYAILISPRKNDTGRLFYMAFKMEPIRMIMLYLMNMSNDIDNSKFKIDVLTRTQVIQLTANELSNYSGEYTDAVLFDALDCLRSTNCDEELFPVLPESLFGIN